MATFQFYLNGTLLADEPKGWDDSRKKLARSEIYDNVFVEYVTDLVFHGDGRAIILAAIEQSGICVDMAILIKYRCSEFSNYETYFDGVLKLHEAEFNDDRCEIRCNAEDASLIDLLFKRMEKKVMLTDTSSITGVTTCLISQRTIGIHSADSPIHTNRNSYRVHDVFGFLVKYYTDGQITYTSDFFGLGTSTSGRITQKITWNNPADLISSVGGVILNMRWVDYFGGIHNTGQIALSSNPSVSLDRVCTALNNMNQASYLGGEISHEFKDFRYFAKVTHNGSNEITLISDLPTRIPVASNPKYLTITNPEPEFPSNGKGYLYITSGTMLRGTSEVFAVSFKDLFTELTKLLNLSFSITRVAGVQTLRIEPLSYFIENTEAVELTNVYNIKHRPSTKYNKTSIDVGDTDFYTGYSLIYPNFSGTNDLWVSSSKCFSDNLDLQGKFITDANSIFYYCNNNLYRSPTWDEALYLIECEASLTGNSGDAILYEGNIWDTGGGSHTYYAINAQLTNYWRIGMNMMRISGNPKFGSRTITNNKEIFLDNEYEFEAPVTYEQQREIFNNKNRYITFNPGTNPQDKRKGYIQDIEFNNKTSIAQFKLLSK